MFSRFLAYSLFLFLGFSANGQGDFRVIFNSGNNYQRTEKGFFEVKNGSLLKPENALEVMPNGKVILMDNAGRLIQLELEGRYDLSTLDLTQLSSPSKLIYEEWENFYTPRRKTADWLAVESLQSQSDFIDLHLNFPSSTEIYGRFIELSWTDIGDKYQLRFWNEYDRIFQTLDVGANAYTIDILSQSLAFKDAFGIEVLAKNSGRSTGVYFLDKLSPPDKELLTQLLRVFPDNGGLIIELTKAIILENHGLYADASTAYQRLVSQFGTELTPFYQQYLDRFGY